MDGVVCTPSALSSVHLSPVSRLCPPVSDYKVTTYSYKLTWDTGTVPDPELFYCYKWREKASKARAGVENKEPPSKRGLCTHCSAVN